MFRSMLYAAGVAGISGLAACASATPEPELTGGPPAAARDSLAAADTAAAPANVAPTDTAAVRLDSTAVLELGRRVTDLFWTADGDGLWPLMGEQLRTNMGSPAAMSEGIFGFISQTGMETEVLSESVAQEGEAFVYRRIVHVDAAQNPWSIGWRFDRTGALVDLDIAPAAD